MPTIHVHVAVLRVHPTDMGAIGQAKDNHQSSHIMTSILDLAHEWLRLDQNTDTRKEVETLLAQHDTPQLERIMRKRIAFGTAGLRATVGAGFSRMNDLTVIQASQGLAAYLLQNENDVEKRGVVIGRDARFHSDDFARLTAAVFMSKNIRVHWLGQVHTPMVPYTIGKLNAVAGVMVTASHNPAADNGYKVYWSNGCQIIPPIDVGIAQAISENLEPTTWDKSMVNPTNPLMSDALDMVQGDYMAAIARISRLDKVEASIPFVYTPMHGVGLPFFTSALQQLRLELDMHVVEAQAYPDPTFPTVKFPNPEEKGALDLAKQVADSHGITLILANDPDADRFAVAEKVDGVWKQITGNQMGVLLASHVMETYQADPQRKGLAMLASTVSSKMIARMAAVDKNFHFEETLTGFKWLGNRAQDLQKAGYDALYAYEEAIGYMFSEGGVFDKDGVVAAAVFLSACHRWHESDLTPWSKYQQLCQRYGYFEEANTYLISPSPDVTNTVFSEIRENQPQSVGSRPVLRWRDLTIGVDTGTFNKRPLLPVDASSQMISCELQGDVQFTVRGSGTEPKIKLYIEGRAATSDAARKAANEVLDNVVAEWFNPKQYGLKLA